MKNPEVTVRRKKTVRKAPIATFAGNNRLPQIGHLINDRFSLGHLTINVNTPHDCLDR